MLELTFVFLDSPRSQPWRSLVEVVHHWQDRRHPRRYPSRCVSFIFSLVDFPLADSIFYSFGMTSLSVRSYSTGIYRVLGLKEEEVTKVQTGGPDGDLGSNEILLSKDKTIACVVR